MWMNVNNDSLLHTCWVPEKHVGLEIKYMISVPNHNSPGINLGLNISLNSYMILEKHHLGEKSFKKLLSLFENSNKHHSCCLLYHSILCAACQCWPRQGKHLVKERGKSIFEALFRHANSTDACRASDRGWSNCGSWAAPTCERLGCMSWASVAPHSAAHRSSQGRTTCVPCLVSL